MPDSEARLPGGPGEGEWLEEVYRTAAIRSCDERALVLEALGIAAHRAARDGYYALLVAPDEAARARAELARYAAENQPRPPPPPPPHLYSGAIPAAVAYVLVLVAVTAGSTRAAFGRDWYAAGVLDGAPFRQGEWWRAVTALTLHADLAHLAGNAGFGVLFGIPVARLYGPGLGWLAVLLAAASANALEACWMAPRLSSLGASTAVFAALGLMAARGRAALGGARHRRYRQAGLAAALVLLALLGTGDAQTDVLAHALGFAVGLGLGLALRGQRVPLPPLAQRACAIATLALLAAAWVTALARAG